MKLLGKQFKSLIPVILFAYTPAIIFLALIALYAHSKGIRTSFFSVLPVGLWHLPFYIGIISNISILLWCATAGICFFSTGILKKFIHKNNSRYFLFVSGIFTSILCCDEMFQLHNINFFANILFYLWYGAFTIWYLIYFRKQILETEYLLLAFSFLFYIIAVIIDILPILPKGSTSFSDGLKLLGIVSWFVYFTRTCRNAVNDTI